MLFVTNLEGETEPLNAIQNFEMNEEVGGTFTVSFTSFFDENNPGYALLDEESIVNVDGYEFRIKQLESSIDRKFITAVSTFYDLVGIRKETTYGGTRTFDDFASFIMSDTGWTFTSSVSGSAFVPNFGDDNVIKLTQWACVAFECEFKIMQNKHVHFSKEIGPDNDAQYRYGHNVKALSKSVDTTNLRTSIKGYGAGGLVVTYTSPNESKFPDAGEAEPVRDDRFTIPESLVARVKSELVDYPETSIELDSVELADKELGERVWLIYEPLDIEFQTRILSKKTIMREGELVTASVVIGNTIPRDLSDVLTSQKVEIDENAKQTQSKFEQTNNRITMEVERIDDSIATLEITAENIRLSVTNLANDTSAEFLVMSDRIESKVNGTDYNGQTIMSMIEQTPSYITLSAKKINFDGEVFGNSNARFEGEVRAERIIGNEISGVVLRTSNANQFIRMQAQEMVLWDGVYDKMRIGFRNSAGSLTQVPYVIMGYGDQNGRDKMIMSKDVGYFELIYTGNISSESSIRMVLNGNMSISASNTMYLTTGLRIVSNNDIHAPEFINTSTVKAKDVIREFTDNATDIVNRTNVYTYYLKKDLENHIYNNQQIGFLTEASPELRKDDGVNIYKALSIAWKSLQEKDAELNSVKQRLDDIELLMEVMT